MIAESVRMKPSSTSQSAMGQIVQFCPAPGLAAPIGFASLGQIIWPARGHLIVHAFLAKPCQAVVR